jgi:hypothetical protein
MTPYYTVVQMLDLFLGEGGGSAIPLGAIMPTINIATPEMRGMD